MKEIKGREGRDSSALGRAAVFSLLVLAAAGVAVGQDLGDRVTVSGYGAWTFGDTDSSNHYLSAGPDGEYEHALAALNFHGRISDTVVVYVQTHFENTHDTTEVELDFAFADWEFVESHHLRAGRVKHPFGIYTEIFDVGTLRPFLDLPAGVYHSQTVARAYNGLGLAGSVFLGSEWGLEYDLYGGQIDLASSAGNTVLEEKVRDTIGARVILNTPLQGLRFGFSGYTGDQEESETDVIGSGGSQDVYGVLAEYLAGGWSVRGEWTEYSDEAGSREGAYFEVARMFGSHWQVAGRWDSFESDFDLSGFPEIYSNFQEHEDLALAVNYWVNPKLVFKAEYHMVEGNRFAAPEDLEGAIMEGTFTNETDAIQLGVNFAF